jgi:hypothetical protein
VTQAKNSDSITIEVSRLKSVTQAKNSDSITIEKMGDNEPHIFIAVKSK